MKVLKSLCIAFAMYSKIPVPQFEWKQEDMRYMLCFFPWIGAVIGVVEVAWFQARLHFGVGSCAYVLAGAAIPIIITGGFHIDGFLDTADARSSYQSREKKLAILKDPHIGAFAVIRLALYYMLYLAAFSEVKEWRMAVILGIGFALSRGMSGVAVITMQPAKKDSSLNTVSGAAAKRISLVALILQMFFCIAAIFFLSFWSGVLVVAGMVGCFASYRSMAYKEFGGVTGDTAGYFLQCCELAIVIAVAVGGYIG